LLELEIAAVSGAADATEEAARRLREVFNGRQSAPTTPVQAVQAEAVTPGATSPDPPTAPPAPAAPTVTPRTAPGTAQGVVEEAEVVGEEITAQQ
jgi:hypothetical protein